MKRFSTLLLINLLVIGAFAQDIPFKSLRSQGKRHRCYTVEVQSNFLKNHPNAESQIHFESWLQSKIAEHKRLLAAQGKITTFGTVTSYTLPIVFHVVHNGEKVGTAPNIAASYIQAQLLQLNKDYVNLSGSSYSVAASTGIQFALATQDPNGKVMAEPGIDRVNRVTKKWGAAPFEFSTTVTDTIKPATIWDPYRYVNVWMLEDVTDNGNSGILGIATLPTSGVLDGLDSAETDKDAGVVIGSTTVGSIFSSTTCGDVSNPYTLGRTLTHELGHFFGLRHIWGDSTCATDYCDDTPIHFDANFGKPTHPKPNSCGTADEMFEDYMDYTDDDIMNTFTADQVSRMQTVMLNSPRRMTLATSTAASVLPAGSNKLAFSNCSGVLTVPETGNAGITQRHRDVNIALNVEKFATGNATVFIKTGGTAKKGIDYVVMNDTLSFAANDGAKSVTVRVLDNNAIDGDRTVVLSYSISGTGVVAAATAQTLTITIKDDDNKIIGNNPVNVLNENFGTKGGNIPTGWTTDSTAGSANAFVVGSVTNTVSTGQYAYITNNVATKPLTYTKSATYSYTVLSTPMINGSGYKTIDTLKFKYKAGGSAYNSTSGTGAYGTVNYTLAPFDINYIAGFGDSTGLMGNGPYNTVTTVKAPALVAPQILSGNNFYIHFLWECSTKSGKNPGLCVDDVVLNASPFAIDSVVSKSYSLVVPASTTNLIRSTSDDIVASVTSVASTVKSFTASIPEAGTGKVAFKVGNTTYQRSKKVLSFANGTSDTSTTYSTTLYYTSSEFAAWSSSLSGLRVLQLKNGTSFASGTISGATATVLTPTAISDKRATDGYVAITISGKGMSSFALVDSAVLLPLSWKYVTAAVQNNATVVKWQLYTPVIGAKYAVERSNDGINFSTIQSGIETNSLTDANIVAGTNYYYRVVASAPDGSRLYSQVLNVVYLSLNHSFTIAPNPFAGKLVIQNNGGISGKTILSVVDIAGRAVYGKTYNNEPGTTTINTSSWMPGVYVVRVNNAGTSITYKLVKQ